MNCPLDLCEPSTRLLDHYKKKTEEWKERVLDLMSQVEDCKVVCSQFADAEIELQKREVEVSKLQSQLSETRRTLYDEKKQVMKLVDDKDKLRLELLECRRAFKTVLDVLGLKECEVASFLETPKEGLKDQIKSARIKRGVKKILNLGLDPNMRTSKLIEDLQTANLRIKLLESQLEEQHCLFQEEIENLLEERRNLLQTREEERKRLQHRISCLNCRLETTRKQICDKLTLRIDKQSKNINSDIKLILENEKLMKCLMICKELLGDEFPGDLNDKRPKILKDEITKLQGMLSEKTVQISSMQAQVSLLRAQMNNMQKENELTSEEHGKEKQKLIDKYEMMVKRFEKEHRRRVTDAVGFRNDVKLLRSSLQSLQRQIRIKEIRNKGDGEAEEIDKNEQSKSNQCKSQKKKS